MTFKFNPNKSVLWLAVLGILIAVLAENRPDVSWDRMKGLFSRIGIDMIICATMDTDHQRSQLKSAALSGDKALFDLTLQRLQDCKDPSQGLGYIPRNTLVDAVKGGNTDIVSLMLSLRIDIDKTGDDFVTIPLYAAAEENNIEMVKFLIESGADIDNYGPYKRTSLHIASVKGHSNVVEFLVEKKAKLNVVSTLGYTPRRLAKAENHKAIEKYLREKGAKLGDDPEKCIASVKSKYGRAAFWRKKVSNFTHAGCLFGGCNKGSKKMTGVGYNLVATNRKHFMWKVSAKGFSTAVVGGSANWSTHAHFRKDSCRFVRETSVTEWEVRQAIKKYKQSH